ncbi:type II toxin-antitoxin system prevent-host-death family antitoxin [Piscirickettsia litoralis]|uniref:Antitoxin n=1 Tax=Piscirickettsia litoralis TaxID=1891921 RepID=A0ABX2ZXR3_9GAMM|nr:type II toxin-antitoxin system prevent-host-death family antitoxin [Piscirickettsia litoralis]ODN41013.1 hypothetical protein BGC07_18450 [Piscirickettsia litoralis]
MSKQYSLSEFRKNVSQIIGDVCEGESVAVATHGKNPVQIITVEEYQELLKAKEVYDAINIMKKMQSTTETA